MDEKANTNDNGERMIDNGDGHEKEVNMKELCFSIHYIVIYLGTKPTSGSNPTDCIELATTSFSIPFSSQ